MWINSYILFLYSLYSETKLEIYQLFWIPRQPKLFPFRKLSSLNNFSDQFGFAVSLYTIVCNNMPKKLPSSLYTYFVEYRRWLRQPQTYPIFSMLYWSTVNLMWMFCANSTTKVGQRGELVWLLIRCLSDMKLNPTKGSCCFLEVETLPSLLQYWLVPGTDSSMTSQSNVNELV